MEDVFNFINTNNVKKVAARFNIRDFIKKRKDKRGEDRIKKELSNVILIRRYLGSINPVLNRILSDKDMSIHPQQEMTIPKYLRFWALLVNIEEFYKVNPKLYSPLIHRHDELFLLIFKSLMETDIKYLLSLEKTAEFERAFDMIRKDFKEIIHG